MPTSLTVLNSCAFSTQPSPCVMYVCISHVQNSVTYHLPSVGMTWSAIFRLMETNKERLGIIDYSVSQTTLDQVSFIRTVVVTTSVDTVEQQ